MNLEPSFNEVQPFLEQYFAEIEFITKEYLSYFFGKHHHDEAQKVKTKSAFFDSNFQLTTNLVNKIHLSGGHVATNPACKNFPSIISRRGIGVSFLGVCFNCGSWAAECPKKNQSGKNSNYGKNGNNSNGNDGVGNKHGNQKGKKTGWKYNIIGKFLVL